MTIIIYIFVFCAATLFAMWVLPLFLSFYQGLQKRKLEGATKKLDALFVDVQQKRLASLLFIAPIALFVVGLILTSNIVVGFGAGVVGFILPNIYIKSVHKKRVKKFEEQLIDSLVVLSACLKAGLSLVQAFEVIVEDMPPPISQEIAWMLKEVKLGMSLEESLRRLNKRMPSSSLTMVVNSVAVAGVTGGDLVKVFSRLITTLRNNRKLQDNIATLTMQGRMQGIILSVLPIIFAAWVLSTNKNYFDIMLNSEQGKFLLMLAAVLQVVGVILIKKFSIVKI